jgi:hypothetical protein
VTTNKKLPEPARRSRDVTKYSADDLHAMLVDDGVKYRPLGGDGMSGVQWMMDALTRIAAYRRIEVDLAFAAVLEDVEAQTGRKWVAVA